MSNKRFIHHKELQEHIEYIEAQGFKEISNGVYLIPCAEPNSEEQESMDILTKVLDFDFIVKKRHND